MKKSIVILLHAGYWACVLLIMFVFSLVLLQPITLGAPETVASKNLFNIFTGIALIPALASFYLYYFFLFPEYIKKKNILKTIGVSLLFSIVGSIEGYIYLSFTLGSDFMPPIGSSVSFEIFLFIVIIATLNGIMGFIMRGFFTWFNDISVKEELANKNHQMEMALVKAQLDPHFLFNTINNIDVLIQKKPEAASDYLNKLSEILRFMLFETKAEKISLNKEMDYISKFIELQRIRSSNKEFVTFTGKSSDLEIAPMIFMPFIENAFKHCSDKKASEAIQINIQSKGTEIFFSCKNVFDVSKKAIGADHGLGLELINKRLLAMYPDNHELKVNKTNNQYSVELTIQTNEH